MDQQQLIQLLEKFAAGTITPEEKAEWQQWLPQTDRGTRQQLIDLHEKIVLSQRNLPAADEQLLSAILQRIQEIKQKEETAVVYLWKRWAVAASILLVLGLGAYFAFFNKSTTEPPPITKTDIPAPDKSRATITLADGRVIPIDSLTTINQANITVTKTVDGQIVYAGLGNMVVFNTLSNPKGSKVIDLVLNDGSHLWLNAGSSVTYPVAFIGNDRKVSITGEAYFEVTKDSRPFSVSKGDMTVQVLGTKFNVNAYEDEGDIRVTLLEGSVSVSANATKQTIKPGQQAIVNGSNQLRVTSVVDLDQVMAWRNGLFNFNNADLQTVLRQLARWYDVEVVYQGAIPKREFGGKMQRDLNLSDVLKILEKNNVNFKIEGKRLIVLP